MVMKVVKVHPNHLRSYPPKRNRGVSDYTGANRIKPNPMKYESQSWFLRGGCHFSEQHYIGGILNSHNKNLISVI